MNIIDLQVLMLDPISLTSKKIESQSFLWMKDSLLCIPGDFGNVDFLMPFRSIGMLMFFSTTGSFIVSALFLLSVYLRCGI